jgi:hypothetical protein
VLYIVEILLGTGGTVAKIYKTVFIVSSVSTYERTRTVTVRVSVCYINCYSVCLAHEEKGWPKVKMNADGASLSLTELQRHYSPKLRKSNRVLGREHGANV